MCGAESTPQEWQQARFLGAAIRAARVKAGFTQIELAARLTERGRPSMQAEVSRIERGKSRLMLCTYVHVVRAIGRDPGTLLTRVLKAEQAQQAEPGTLA